jgi:hypothetical protein
MRADIHYGQEHQSSTHGPDTEVPDQSLHRSHRDLQHAAELAQGPLKACLTGRRQREEMKAPNAYGFGASAFRTCVPR